MDDDDDDRLLAEMICGNDNSDGGDDDDFGLDGKGGDRAATAALDLRIRARANCPETAIQKRLNTNKGFGNR